MKGKILFNFLFAVAFILPLATAFNCTALNGEEHNSCIYIENTDWSQSDKDLVIQNILDSGGVSLNGDFESIFDKEINDSIKLNNIEESELKIDKENKIFLMNFSLISLFGYSLFSFLKGFYLRFKRK
ncbi:MAG: hypothetical protein WC812_01930 [Candidatus Pacearchaeota archaeon]|jgi:hypothetical protein